MSGPNFDMTFTKDALHARGARAESCWLASL
jgi:hypothetical protein